MALWNLKRSLTPPRPSAALRRRRAKRTRHYGFIFGRGRHQALLAPAALHDATERTDARIEDLINT